MARYHVNGSATVDSDLGAYVHVGRRGDKRDDVEEVHHPKAAFNVGVECGYEVRQSHPWPGEGDEPGFDGVRRHVPENVGRRQYSHGRAQAVR